MLRSWQYSSKSEKQSKTNNKAEVVCFRYEMKKLCFPSTQFLVGALRVVRAFTEIRVDLGKAKLLRSCHSIGVGVHNKHFKSYLDVMSLKIDEKSWTVEWKPLPCTFCFDVDMSGLLVPFLIAYITGKCDWLRAVASLYFFTDVLHCNTEIWYCLTSTAEQKDWLSLDFRYIYWR